MAQRANDSRSQGTGTAQAVGQLAGSLLGAGIRLAATGQCCMVYPRKMMRTTFRYKLSKEGGSGCLNA